MSVEAVWRALATVDDPEYPGVSITALGLVESVVAHNDTITIELVPTYSGCPALELIEQDVRACAVAVTEGSAIDVRWRRDVAWTTERVSATGRAALSTSFGVAFRSLSGALRCPACGSAEVAEQTPIGPARCRAVAWCVSCRNVVEVMR